MGRAGMTIHIGFLLSPASSTLMVAVNLLNRAREVVLLAATPCRIPDTGRESYANRSHTIRIARSVAVAVVLASL